MSAYTRPSPVTAPSPHTDQPMVKNDGGGYSFATSSKNHLLRFLILGSDKNGYYVDAPTNFARCNDSLKACLREMGTAFIDLLVDVSVNNRAPKVDPVIYALAYATVNGSPEQRAAALANLSQICRIPTHLFSFLTDVKNLGGKTGGRAFRRALQTWYLGKRPSNVAYHMIKYRQRGGWTHADVLRLCKPAGYNSGETEYGDLFAFATNKPIKGSGKHLEQITAFLALRGEEYNVRLAVEAITLYGLPREAIPDQYLKEKSVWRALLLPSPANKDGMPLTALIRTLNRMTALGVFYDKDALDFVTSRVNNEEALRAARIHPISILIALRQYSSGRGEKGDLMWQPNHSIIAALDSGFHKSFKTAPTMGKRICLGLDISSSMEGYGCLRIPSGLKPIEAEAALAKFYMCREPGSVAWGFSDDIRDLSNCFNGDLAACVRKISGLAFGQTNPGRLFEKALKEKKVFDLFLVITDNDVNAGKHSHELFKKYQRDVNPAAKLVVLATASNPFTIAEPGNPDMLDMAGFDSSVPEVLASFMGM